MQYNIVKGEQGWFFLQGVLPRAIFRRPPVSGHKYFTVMSLHIGNTYAKKKGIAKKLIQTLRALKPMAQRCRSRDNLSTIDEAFADCALLTPPGPTPLWGPGSIPNNWADVCGFLNTPALSASGKSISMVRFLSLGKLLASNQMIKVGIMRHGFICISSIGTTNGTIKRTTTGTSALGNDLRVLDMEFKNVTSAKL